MRALTPRSRLHGEGGASLAIILALIAILGLCVGAIATQGTAGMLAVQGVKNQRADIYGAEGAIDAAINYIRGDLTRGRWDDTRCPADSAAELFKAPSDVGTVTVTCKSLAPGGVEIEGVNYPENAVRTMSGVNGYPQVDTRGICPGDPGICIGGNNSGTMFVDGSVKSNAARAQDKSIETRNGSRLNVSKNSIRATGLCTPVAGFESWSNASPLDCATGDTYPDPGGGPTSDPTTGGWAAEMLTVPPIAPQPSCNTTSKVATMEPGSYFSRDQMLLGFSKVVSGTRRSCPIVWMKPGNYYFDLDKATDMDPWRIGYDDAGRTDDLYSDTFTGTDIPGSVVIGGTPSGWDPNATSSQVTAARNAVGDPGACSKTSGTGVQVMMANYTAFDVKDQGMLELCPNPHSSRQQIALYGRKTNQTGSSTTAVVKPTGNTGTLTPSTFGPIANALSIDNSVASGTQTGNNKTNLITLSGYSAANLVPQQTFTNAVLRIAHREVTTPSNLSVSVKVTVTASDGNTCNNTFPKQTTLATATPWTIPTSCIGSLDDLTGATAKVEFIGGSGSGASLTSELDGVEITANYTAQGLQAKTAGSKIVWMYGDYANKRPEIYIWGTVYAPTSRIELGLDGVSTTIARFGRGVVVAGIIVIDLEVTQSYAAFANASGVPHYQDRYLELIAYIGGKAYLRVLVQFDDTDTSTPGKTIKIIRWNAVN
jgi:hypothetical protein